MPLRGSVREATRLRGTQRRLDRGAAEAPAAGDPVRRRARAAAARRAASHRASRGARGTVWTEARRRHAAALRRGRPRASRAARARFPQARGEARSRSREPALRGGARRHGQARLGARPGEPLGLVHGGRRALLFVAADPRAALRARLSGGARGRASGRDESLARGSGAWSRASAPTGSAPRPGSTRTAPRCTAMAGMAEQRPRRPTTAVTAATR